MNARKVLDGDLFFVRESTGFLKAAYNYDVLDPGTRRLLLQCREQNMGVFTRLFRFSDLRRATPFDFLVNTAGGARVMRITRGVALFSSRILVLDDEDTALGGFALKPFSISGDFDVLDATGLPVCQLRGNLTGRSYRFLAPDGVELARVERKWAGVGKELFSGGADYMLQIDNAVPRESATRCLILASVLCVGMVLKVDS